MKRIILLFFCLSLCQTAASAQLRGRREPDRWEFSGFGGWGNLSGRDSFPTLIEGGESNLVRLDADDGYLLGLRITENRKRFFGAEFEYTLADQPLELVNLSPALPRLGIDQRIHNFSYNGVIYLKDRRSRWRPFGTAGVGASFYQLSGDTEARGVAQGLDLRSRWKFAFSFGGGVKYLVGEHWGVRFDFRDRVTTVPDYGIPRMGVMMNGISTPSFRPDGMFHHLELSVGFVYRFKGL